MHSFKKALLSTISTIITVIVFSYIIVFPFLSAQDNRERKELAGSIDFVVIGASQAQFAFSSQIIDSILDVKSYNLSSILLSMDGRYCLLKKEIARNPINTVVLEVSYDTLKRDSEEALNEGDPQFLAKLDTLNEKLEYIFSSVTFNGLLNIYARSVIAGVSSWKNIVFGHGNEPKLCKGFSAQVTNDITLPQSVAKNKHNRWSYETSEIRTENLDKLKKIVDMCKDNDIRVIVVITPLSDGFIWQHSKIDEFSKVVSDFCEENKCEFYDLNLDKNRFSLYSDKQSFLDELHLSETGATSMSERFCQLIKEEKTDKDKKWHYDNYEEMKADSPYMKVLKSESE